MNIEEIGLDGKRRLNVRPASRESFDYIIAPRLGFGGTMSSVRCTRTNPTDGPRPPSTWKYVEQWPASMALR